MMGILTMRAFTMGTFTMGYVITSALTMCAFPMGTFIMCAFTKWFFYHRDCLLLHGILA